MTDHKAEPMRGSIIEVDFGKGTMTFRMEPPYYASSGEFLIAPIGGGISLDSLTAAPAASEAPINSDGIDSKLIGAASEGEDVRLWDSQWVNVVNHANCYEDFTKEEAVAHAVKMTEQYMRSNITAGFPSTRPAAQVAATPKHDEGREAMAFERADDPCCTDSFRSRLMELAEQADEATNGEWYGAGKGGGAVSDFIAWCSPLNVLRLLREYELFRAALATQPAARRVTDEEAP